MTATGPGPGPPSLPHRTHATLLGILAEAQRLGFLGPGAVQDHVQRALDLSLGVETPPHSALDLGSGAGIPGLPLALLWEESMWVLLDGSAKRTSFLSAAVEALGLSPRVEVASGRAEELGRGPLRGTIDLVVARSFAAPAATAECAAGFLRVGGQLLVAEPPGGAPERWASEALDLLGLAIGRSSSQPTALQILDQVRPCPDRYPRRVGVPSKRPLF